MVVKGVITDEFASAEREPEKLWFVVLSIPPLTLMRLLADQGDRFDWNQLIKFLLNKIQCKLHQVCYSSEGHTC